MLYIDLLSHNLVEHSYNLYLLDFDFFFFIQIRAGLIFSSMLVISFSYHISLVSIVNGYNRHPCVIPEVNGTISNISPVKSDVYGRSLVDSLFLGTFQTMVWWKEKTHICVHICTHICTHTQYRSRLKF